MDDAHWAGTVLRESEGRFRLMADAAPVMIWMSGPDKLYTYFNKGWLEFTGRSITEELGNGWGQGVHAEDLERCLDTYNRALDARQPFSMEYRLRRFDGEYRWILDTGVSRFESDGTFAGYIGSGIDITERKQVEQALSNRLQFETLLSELSATFVSLPSQEVDYEIGRWLEHLVEFLEIDRGTFFEFADDGQTLHRTHSYARPGITLLPKIVMNEQFPWITKQLRQGKTVMWSRIPNDMPEEAKAERAYAMQVGAKSGLNIPVAVGGRVVCAIAFTSVRCYRTWDAELVPRLRLVGEVFANTLVRRRAEEVLRLSEERYRALGTASGQIIWRTNAQGEALFVTPAWQELTGQRDAEMSGHVWLNAVHPDDRARAMQAWEESVRNKRLHEVEFRVLMRDGSCRDFHVRAVPILAPDGSVREWVGANIDMTPRKRSEEAIRKSEALFRTLFDRAGIGIALVDHDGRPIETNGALEDMLRYGGEELRRMRFAEFTHPEDVEKDLGLFGELLDGKRDRYQMEKRYIRKDGVVIWGNLIVSMIPSIAGEAPLILGMAEDITERKRAEAALRESEARFRALFESNVVPIAYWHTDGRTLDANEAYLRLTGYSRDELKVGHMHCDLLTPPEYHHLDRQAIEELLAGMGSCTPFEKEYMLRDGCRVPVLIAGSLLPGYTDRGVVFAIDLSERKRAEAALRELSGRLIHAQEEERGRIGRELHDDVNQRLALIGIEIEQLGQQSATSAAQLGARSRALWKKVRELSADIHNLSHDLHPSKLDHLGLESAARGFCNDLRGRGDLRIECVCHDVPHSLPKDIALCLYRVLQEAIQNAVTHSGARDAKVEICGSPSLITLRVSDSGIGFNPDADSIKTGLGLISMRERVRLIGGELSIQSRPSEGTRIEAQVPLASSVS